MSIDIRALQDEAGKVFTGFMDYALDNPRRVNEFRLAAAELLDKDRNVFDLAINNLFNALEASLITNAHPMRDMRDLEDFVETYFSNYVPFCIYEYYGTNNMSAQDARQIERDARAYANACNTWERTISEYERRQRSGGSRFAGRPGTGSRWGTVGGGGRRDEDDGRGVRFRNSKNTFGAHKPAGGLLQTEHGRESGGDSDGFFGSKRSKSRDYSGGGVVSVRGKQKEEVNDDDYEDMVIETPQTKYVPPKPKATQAQATPRAEKPTPKANPRKRGIYWFSHEVEEQFEGRVVNKKVVNTMNDHTYRAIRERYAPQEIYPIPVEDLVWDDGDAYIEVDYPDGQTIKEWVFKNNVDNPCWVNWDKTQYKCVIELNGNYLPVQAFVELSEEEKMKIEQHKVPGKRPLDGVFTTVVPVRAPEAENLQNAIEALALTEEERKKQEEELIASGGEFTESDLTVLKEIMVDNNAVLVDDVMDAIYKETDSAKVVQVPYVNMELTFTKENRQGLIKSIANCKTFDDFKKKIYDKLVEQKEYILLNRLSKLIDVQYNKLLVKLGLFNLSVTDVILDYADVLAYGYIPNELINDYHAGVAKMFSTLIGATVDYGLDPEDESPAAIGSDGIVVYVNRLLSELNLVIPDKSAQAQPWLSIDKHSKTELYQICSTVLLKALRERNLGRDIYILTTDGILLEVMAKNPLNPSSILVNYSNC